MNSANYQQQSYPTLSPPPLSAGGHGISDPYDPPAAPQPPPASNDQYITPYLGLRSRLSQIWINRWTVLLLLVLVRLLLSISSINSLIDSARSEALAACIQVQNVGSTFASLPHFMAQGVNSLTGEGITKAVSALVHTLDLMITGVETIVLFYIGMLTDTYLCLITAAVDGSIGAVTGAVESAQGAANTTLQGIANDISGVASGLEKSINSLLSGINSVFGSKAPTVDFTKQIDELKNFKLPSNLDADLIKLNKSMPTFAQVKNFTNGLISIPFNDLKTLINDHLGNYTFDHSVFPIPQKTALTFCSDNNNINNFFDDLRKIADVAKKVFITVLVLLAAAACIPVALLEIRGYRSARTRAVTVRDYAVDAMDAVYLASRPYTSTLGRKAGGVFQTNKRTMLARWFVAYITSTPALLLIALAVTGFFSCFCQFILLKVITKEVPALTAEIVGFAEKVVGTVNNASQTWATDANGLILTETSTINKDVLGWVNTSTTAVNNTLNGFIDETVGLLNTTFGGTVFYKPILTVFNCLIGIKVAGIESGLTWVQQHTQVSLPLLPNNTMTLGDILSKANNNSTGSNSTGDVSTLLNDPGQATQDGVTAAINKVGDAVLKSIRQEALISLMLLVVWFIIVLMGLGYVIWKSCTSQQSVTPGGSNFWYDEKSGQNTEMYQVRQPEPAYYQGEGNTTRGLDYGDQTTDDPFDDKQAYATTTVEAVFPPQNQNRYQPEGFNQIPNQEMIKITKSQSRFSD